MDFELKDWIGRTESVSDVVTATPCAAFSATLDRDGERPAAGTPLPPLWHWLYFLPLHRQSDLGADGHAKRGGFLPPVPLPRRMWAGSQFEFRAAAARRRRGHAGVDDRRRDGKARAHRPAGVREGPPRHAPRWRRRRRAHRVPRHRLSRSAESGRRRAAAQGRAARSAWEREWVPDDVLLFRYSALTFNGHRIHYDRRYVTEVEGYPGLVVHGPLLATLLLDLLRREMPDAEVAHYEFRAMRPVFDLNPFYVCGEPQDDGKTVKLWVRDHEGWLTMDATAVLR